MDKSQITVDEFTTPSPVSVRAQQKLPEAWELMTKEGIRHLLVRDDMDSVVGILSQRDLTTFSQSPGFNEIEAQDVMSRDIVTVTPQTKLFEVALRMSQEKIGSALVMEPGGEYMGIFTATDALNALVEVLRGDLDQE
jgi:acetoin utilization protein AcuB